MTHVAREAADSARWPAGGGLLGGPAAGLRNCEVTRFFLFFFLTIEFVVVCYSSHGNAHTWVLGPQGLTLCP